MLSRYVHVVMSNMSRRIGRYLQGCPRLVQMFQWEEPQKEVTMHAWTDSDWAGCPSTRKSTSGGAMVVSGHMLKAYSSTQSVIALSSAEAELYALVKAASVAMGVASMARDFGEILKIELRADSSAAIGIAYRQGLGKVRHLDVQQLWVQQRVLNKELKLLKVMGVDNIADMMTKYLPSDAIGSICDQMGFVKAGGRAASAPTVSRG